MVLPIRQVEVQSSLQCTASLCSASLGSTLPSWIVSALSAGMRLLRLAHSIWDHSVLVLCFSDLCLRAPGRGGPGFRGGPCPGLVCFPLVFLVIQDLNLKSRLTVSPAKRASPKFMKMVSFCSSHLLQCRACTGPLNCY